MPLTRKVPKREFKSTRTGTPLSQPSLQWTRLMPGVPSGNRTAQAASRPNHRPWGPREKVCPCMGPLMQCTCTAALCEMFLPSWRAAVAWAPLGFGPKGLVPGWLSSAIHRIKMRTPTNGTRDRNTHAPLRPVS